MNNALDLAGVHQAVADATHEVSRSFRIGRNILGSTDTSKQSKECSRGKLDEVSKLRPMTGEAGFEGHKNLAVLGGERSDDVVFGDVDGKDEMLGSVTGGEAGWVEAFKRSLW